MGLCGPVSVTAQNSFFTGVRWEHRTLFDTDTVHYNVVLLLGLLSKKDLPRLQALSAAGVLAGGG